MDKQKLLFLCTGNACRSQMAEGWARHLLGDRVEVWSAGVMAAGVDPRAVQVMREAGVDISGHRSKPVNELLAIPFDRVITVCDHAAEVCPIFPGKVRMLHHGFADPPSLARASATDAEALGHYRRVRDEIRAFVETLPELLRDS
jgi:arsenate reductase